MDFELDLNKYTTTQLRMLFTKHTDINLLNEFTLQDLEQCKRNLLFKFSSHYKYEELTKFLDDSVHKITKEKINFSHDTQSVIIKNTVKDNLNVNYKNTIHKLILIDSQDRKDLSQSNQTNYIYQLNNKLTNVVSLKIMNIQIPFTFYNIEERRKNNKLTIASNTMTIPDGHYTLDQIIDKINVLDANVSVTIDTNTRKTKIVNKTGSDITIDFKNNEDIISHNLGWYLGFRPKNDSFSEILSTNISSSSVALLPTTKYVILVVNEYTQNQTADTMIKPDMSLLDIKRTEHFSNEPMLELINNQNVSTYLSNIKSDRNLTKAQLFSIAQQNQSKLDKQKNKIQSSKNINNVLGIFPFDGIQSEWGKSLFSDKNDYIREYHGPVDIEKLQVQLYDDTGYLLELNGNDWYFTLLSENLYKY